MKTTFIYALKDPFTGTIRYIGKSDRPKERLREHLKDKERNHRTNWINSLGIIRSRPVLEVLDEVPKAEWEFWEKEWIRWARIMMFPLTNSTEGGEAGPKCFGPLNLTEAQREEKRFRMLGDKNPFFGKKHSDKTKELLSKKFSQRVGWHHSKETREKIGAAHRGRPSPHKGKKLSPEVRARMVAAQRLRRSA